MPTVVTADRGGQFESALLNSLARLLDITHLRTTAFDQAANGMGWW